MKQLLNNYRLEAFGISGALLEAHAGQGSRSHVVGCYRIVVHRVERQLSSFSDTDRLIPAAAAIPANGNVMAICGGDTGCWGKRRRDADKRAPDSSRTCTLL